MGKKSIYKSRGVDKSGNGMRRDTEASLSNGAGKYFLQTSGRYSRTSAGRDRVKIFSEEPSSGGPRGGRRRTSRKSPGPCIDSAALSTRASLSSDVEGTSSAGVGRHRATPRSDPSARRADGVSRPSSTRGRIPGCSRHLPGPSRPSTEPPGRFSRSESRV